MLTVTNGLTLNGGVWTHTKNTKGYNQTDPDVYRLAVDVGTNFTLGAGADIDVRSTGYLKNLPNFNGGGTHGGYGGGGEHGGTDIYDSVFQPTRHGEGSGTSGGSAPQDGGGSVYLTVADGSTIDGDILANVLAGGTYTRAAAGGSVYLETGTIGGTGIVQARGQNSGGGSNTSGGGGGRVAIVLNDGGADFSGYTGLLDARAGTGTNFSIRPAGGTVYLQTGDQTAGTGELRIDYVNLYGDLIDDWATYLTTQDFSSTSVNLINNGHLQIKAGKSSTIGSLEGDASSNLTLDTGQTLTLGGTGASTTYYGAIHGSGDITKTGGGTWTIDGTPNNAHTHTGTIDVTGGTVVLNGALSNTAVTVGASGELRGNGASAGATVAGVLAPGTSVGTIDFGSGLTLESTADFQVEIDGMTVGTYDQAIVLSGDVVLAGSLTAIFGSFPAVGDTPVFIIDNQGEGTTTGIFAGLADGASVGSANGYRWVITYDANAASGLLDGGNDVALFAVPEPTTAALVLLAGLGALRRSRR